MLGTTPFGSLQYREIHGSKMAYIDDGEGDAIVHASKMLQVVLGRITRRR